jgi:hypothetical protein
MLVRVTDKKGVLLGTGTSSLMLSLLPGKVLKVGPLLAHQSPS